MAVVFKQHVATTSGIARQMGDALRQARLQQDISQLQLASILDVSVPVVGKIEHGDTHVRMQTWLDAMGVLGLMPTVTGKPNAGSKRRASKTIDKA